MEILNLIIAVVCGVVLAIIFVALIAVWLTEGDSVSTLRYSKAARKHYQTSKWNARFICPMVAIMSMGMLVMTPFIAFDPRGGVLYASAAFVFSSIFLWFSIRWFLWSLRA